MPFSYILTDSDGKTYCRDKMLHARQLGEELAELRGLISEGWRQANARCWVLQPHGEFSIEMVGTKE